jgi:UPF0716 protein FxsA
LFYIFVSVFIILPVIEIATFIQFGGILGTFNTILLIFITAIIGVYLVRQQGISTILNIQKDIISGNAPIENIVKGLIILLSGLLLLVPGFVTDTIGFLGLFTFTRKMFANILIKRFIGQYGVKNEDESNNVIDAEYIEINDEDEK